MTTPPVTTGITGVVEDNGKWSPEQLEKMATKSKDKDFQNKVIEWTKSMHMRCRTVRQQLERQWYINLAFYSGRQNVAVIPISSASSAATGVRLYVPPAPYYRARPVINRIRPIIRTELAKLTAQKPSATIIPATNEDQDLAAATAGEQIWDSIYRSKKIRSIHRQETLWSLCCGTGFIKTYWNPTKLAKDGTKGDFCYENVTPFHVFVPDLMAEDIEDQPYVIHIQAKTSEWVKMNYPGINCAPNVMEASDILNDSFLNLIGAADYRKNAVLCYEVWVKPGNVEFLPKGGMYTIIGDTIVQMVEGNPYLHQQYPFVKFPHIPTGRFYGDSVINDLVPIQREFNRTRGQIIEAKNKMGHPQLLAAQGAIDASKITTEPGQVVEYKIGYPQPVPLPLQNLPPYVLQEIDRLMMDFEDISGQHQVSKGQVPPGVTAATAISYLQEQDESMLATTYAGIEEGMEKIAYQTMCYVKQYWDVPRLVKVVGRNGQFDVMSFRGSDLRDNTDIRIEAGSALPTSKSAKQALLMDLMTQNFIPPEKGLELMDIGGVQRLYEELQVDSAQAMRENMKMSAVTQQMLDQYLQTFLAPPDPMAQLQSQLGAQFGGMDQAPPAQQLIDPNTGQPLVDQNGQPTAPPLIVPVNSYDNHQVHIQAHNNYRKSQEYENLPPETKSLFEEHVNQHMAMLGVIPGQPAPQVGQNPVSSGGMEAGQITPEALQAVASPGETAPPGPESNQPAPPPPGGGAQPPPQ